MKQIITLFLTLTFILSLPFTVFAEVGDPNVEGGGGGMGSGTATDFWNTGDEGVRVSIVRVADNVVVATPIDITNRTPNNIAAHFGKNSKQHYRNDSLLAVNTGTYQYINPAQALPSIIPVSGSSNNIEAIRSYFTDEQVIRSIANHTGMNFDVLINGDYTMMIEPVAYFTFNSVRMAMTATEAALYDQQLGGRLRSKMAPLTHQNLPLAMFLERADLGYSAWNGSRSERASNSDIISFLGVGIVRFTESPDDDEDEKIDIIGYDLEYRVNTEVITAVTISGGQSDPDRSVIVRFNVGGANYTVRNVYYPHGDSQLVWVRWRTPSVPQNVTITVTATGGASSTNITLRARIVDFPENIPPNPVADDRNNSFINANIPSNPQKTSASWGVWRPWWQAHWVWHSDWRWVSYWEWVSNWRFYSDLGWVDEGRWRRFWHWQDFGRWVDEGWWEFDYDRYNASLTATKNIIPDTMNPTASGQTMKSGYGVNQIVTANISSNQSSAVTGAQNALTYFPEFRYRNYWRVLDRTQSGHGSRFEFRPNNYSTYNRRTHFTPVWFPDGTYTTYTWLIDAWTPAGMLSVNLNDSVTISGSLWDDWQVNAMRP
ncbi:MAG: hypothetical protein FWE74_05645 [Oscillospiraceae bacterium]|nr:hypothetical protein [Oscillospiraceae bacterium]